MGVGKKKTNEKLQSQCDSRRSDSDSVTVRAIQFSQYNKIFTIEKKTNKAQI